MTGWERGSGLTVNVEYALVGLVALLVMIYLAVALLRPDRF
jgi:K+-transporting ATPase KdpF subunit